MPSEPSPNAQLRRSSKSRQSLNQAKELDHAFNLDMKKDPLLHTTHGSGGGILQLGGPGQGDQQDKRWKQIEYQMFLDKQRAEKEMRTSPNRIKEKINSARKMST